MGERQWREALFPGDHPGLTTAERFEGLRRHFPGWRPGKLALVVLLDENPDRDPDEPVGPPDTLARRRLREAAPRPSTGRTRLRP